jgi:hypothetical protein
MRFLLLPMLATVLTVSTANAAVPALTPAMVKLLAPPGLYRFDSSESTVRDLHTSRVDRESRDGISGVTTLIKDAETNPTVLTIQGTPLTVCQHSGPPVLPKPPPSMPEATCKNLSATVEGNTVTLVAQCYNGRTINKVSKIGDNTWEYFHESHLVGGIHPSGSRPILELAQANGTPEQRELASKLLASQPQRDAELATTLAQVDAGVERSLRIAPPPADRAALAKAPNVPKPRQPIARISGTTRWTRISNHCGSVKPGAVGSVLQY